MKLIDIPVPLDSSLPTCPGHVPCSLHEAFRTPGTPALAGLLLRIVGAGGAPARAALRRS